MLDQKDSKSNAILSYGYYALARVASLTDAYDAADNLTQMGSMQQALNNPIHSEGRHRRKRIGAESHLPPTVGFCGNASVYGLIGAGGSVCLVESARSRLIWASRTGRTCAGPNG